MIRYLFTLRLYQEGIVGFSLILICIGGSLWGLENHFDAKVEKRSEMAVTYQLGGRFGDQVMCYLHAKWISYRYKIPLFYKPFKYSDQLTLDKEEKKFTDNRRKSFSHVMTPCLGMLVDYTERRPSTLYVIPYFPESLWEHNSQYNWYYFAVDWNDPEFVNEIRKMLTPILIQPKLVLPQDRISVAVHIRKGGGFDPRNAWKAFPLKLPPDSYYIEQIERMNAILGGKPLYVYIFTDDKNPSIIMKRLKKHFKGIDIQFDCRRRGNHHDVNVLQDFVEMGRFDCLIRPDSNYSIVVSKITPFKVIISPLHFTWLDKNTGYVDEVEVSVYGKRDRG